MAQGRREILNPPPCYKFHKGLVSIHGTIFSGDDKPFIKNEKHLIQKWCSHQLIEQHIGVYIGGNFNFLCFFIALGSAKNNKLSG